MDAAFQPTLDWISTQRARMIGLTEQWSAINSGSYHLEGIRAMRDALKSEFAVLGGQADLLPVAPLSQIDKKGQEKTIPIAEALRITKRPEANFQILLVGHMDTVFGPDHAFQTPRYVSESVINGPGVADLKGGLAVMLLALQAFEASPFAEHIGWQILLNPDEEIGSISSDPLLKRAALGKQLGLVYEPSLADGTMAGARKGSGNFSITVRGRAAHAGRSPEEGRNAIVAAAEITQQLYALNGKWPGVTVNPGHVEGGGALNVVPDLAILRFNIRTQETANEPLILNEIQKIIEVVHSREGYQASLHGRFTRSPKPMHPRNQQLFEFVQECGRELGQTIAVKPSGGCCDGNNLWKYGLPNVDTLGVRGANIHSDQEIIHLDSLTERAQLSALLLMKLARGDLALLPQP
ncbi:MAG: hydrolase [Rickettsiales bacterium]